ncbi:ABC transporter permease [Microbacterium sp. YY-03]|uniref:ABC transporter permease n=1 Tax=Microbacterium sp. YY-03 TaxID=3421636 RepID=UPI003D17DBB9
MVTAPSDRSRTPARRYLHALRLLSARDLKVRYATSLLGYFWSVLDPLVMAVIYWFIFTQVFQRENVGAEPYIVFLVAGLLPWVWFNLCVSDFTRAFRKDAKLVRSTNIPRSIWIARIIVSKGTEFLLALPVLALFAIFAGATVGWGLLLLPLAVVLQALLLLGLGLLIAPLCVLYSDLERTTKLVLRALFYASPVIYGINDLPQPFDQIAAFNPLAGIFTLYRMAFFPEEFDLFSVVVSVIITLTLLVVGIVTFRGLERTVLKEL